MFEGKEICFINQAGKRYNGVVVACVKGIGVTIVKKEDKERILYCLRMQNTLNFYKAPGEITKTNKMFTAARKRIIAGTLSIKEMYASLDLQHYGSVRVSASLCPFNQ